MVTLRFIYLVFELNSNGLANIRKKRLDSNPMINCTHYKITHLLITNILTELHCKIVNMECKVLLFCLRLNQAGPITSVEPQESRFTNVAIIQMMPGFQRRRPLGPPARDEKEELHQLRLLLLNMLQLDILEGERGSANSKCVPIKC